MGRTSVQKAPRSVSSAATRSHAVCSTPVSVIRLLERRLEALVLNQHPLVLAERCMRRRKDLLHPLDAFANTLRAGVVGTIGNPKGDVLVTQFAANLDGVQKVSQRIAACLSAGITDRSVFVFLRLKQVGIDGTGLDVVLRLQPLDLCNIALAVW